MEHDLFGKPASTFPDHALGARPPYRSQADAQPIPTSQWLCVDALLAAKLAAYEQTVAGAQGAGRDMAANWAANWRVPADWNLVVSAKAQAVIAAIGDNDDWLVLAAGVASVEAAE